MPPYSNDKELGVAGHGTDAGGGDQLLCQRFEGLFERAGGGVFTGWVEVE